MFDLYERNVNQIHNLFELTFCYIKLLFSVNIEH